MLYVEMTSLDTQLPAEMEHFIMMLFGGDLFKEYSIYVIILPFFYKNHTLKS